MVINFDWLTATTRGYRGLQGVTIPQTKENRLYKTKDKIPPHHNMQLTPQTYNGKNLYLVCNNYCNLMSIEHLGRTHSNVSLYFILNRNLSLGFLRRGENLSKPLSARKGTNIELSPHKFRCHIWTQGHFGGRRVLWKLKILQDLF